MNFGHCLIDKKIMGVNVAADLTIREYLDFVPQILEKNEFQRRPVKSSGRVYDLLRRDLVHGCVIPPIILAVTDHYGDVLGSIVNSFVNNDRDRRSESELFDYVRRAASDGELLILDGLQRTLTIVSIYRTFADDYPREQITSFLEQRIRIEVYLGLSKPGILYRMLTLNTGQTPMSFRHQLEILYNDYIDSDNLPDGIRVYRESDDRRARGLGRYKYSDVVDMFYAFSTGSPMPFDRQALVTELREMNFLESYEYSDHPDSMKTLLVTFNSLVNKIYDLAGDWAFDPSDQTTIARPFGTSIVSIFARAQCMAGYGAECKRLIDKGTITDLTDMPNIIEKCSFRGSSDVALNQLVSILDEIAKKAKRIGDSQRVYFQLALRSLFLPESESFSDLSSCWLHAQDAYKLQYD